MPVTVLAGDEEFLLSRRVDELKKNLLDPAWASVNLLCIENASLTEIADAAASLPFGPGNKVVLIERCDLFTKKRGKGQDNDDEKESGKVSAKDKEKELDYFERSLASTAPNTQVIFACPHNFDTTLKTSKVISKHAKIEHFVKEKYWVGSANAKLETWCRKEAHRFGATIDDQAISYLLEGTEADLRQVANEIEKAAVHVLPQKHITFDVIVEISPFHSHVFTLAEAWVAGRGQEALSSVKELLSRQSAMPIIAFLQTTISKWVQMRALSEQFNSELPGGRGVNRRELPFPEMVRKVAAAMKQQSTFVVEKDLKRIAKISTETLIAKRIELTRLEDMVKTGQIPENHALELFFAG
jgi:DNA polymerase III delta subunit